MKRELNCIDDHLTHLYTLVIKPDNSYLIEIDNKIKRRDALEEDWDFLPPKMIDAKIVKSLDKKDNLKITDLTYKNTQDYNQINFDFQFNSTKKELRKYEEQSIIKKII